MFRSMSRRDVERRQSYNDNIPFECALRHVHWLPRATDCIDRSAVSDWMARVERQLPLSMISTEAGIPKNMPTPPLGIPDNLNISSPQGLLLVRVGKSKLVDWEDQGFQLVARLGDQMLESCPVTKSHAGLQEYFIFNLGEVKELRNSELRLLACPYNGTLDGKVRQIKATANGLLNKLTAGKSHLRQSSLQPIEENQPGVNIPLGPLISEKMGSLGICSTASYYLRTSAEPTSPIVGEIALQIVSSPEAFKVFPSQAHPMATAQEREPQAILHQQYLTIPSGNHCWKRVYALLHHRNLHLNDFQRHHQSHGAPINLNSMTDVHFLPVHSSGLENVLVMSFEGEPELMVCADDETQGLEWADAVSRAVWNQPYVYSV